MRLFMPTQGYWMPPQRNEAWYKIKKPAAFRVEGNVGQDAFSLGIYSIISPESIWLMFILPSVRYVRPVMKSRTKTALILIASTLFANLIQDDTAVLFQEFIRPRKVHQFVLASMTEMGLILMFMKLKVWESENQFYFCWIYFDFDIFNWHFDAEKTTSNKSDITINRPRNCFTFMPCVNI